MKNRIKRTILEITILICTISQLYAAPVDSVKEYTLENGMQVYLLEDSSDALVHIEYSVRAGFSSQTQNNCGFFKLFSRLIKSANPELNFTYVQCNSDSSNYTMDISPLETDRVLSKLSDAFFSPSFSDELITSELNLLKKEVTDNAESMSTCINAAIDSRVFSDAPWKNDSGIYPPLFKKTTTKTARSTLQDISNRWYIPKNSAIFISGNINSEKMLVTLKQTFGRFYSNYQTPVEKPSIPINKQRKYVFHSSEISSDLTQVVVQYTMLDMQEADLLSGILNNDASQFKQEVLSLSELNIPGAEYIDVSAAHKRDTSRLIFQTLIQPPENKSLGLTSLQQADEFIEEIYRIPQLIDQIEVQFAKKQQELYTSEFSSTPVNLMSTLASFWAFSEYYQPDEEDSDLYPDSPLTGMLLNRTNRINSLDLQQIIEKLQAEAPFVFIIINSKDYNKNKKAYAAAGYEEINEKNSSWYVQAMYKEIKEQFKPVETQNYSGRLNLNDNSYYAKNIAQFQQKTLQNGIEIISKQNANATGITLLLSIKGGKLNSADDNGFEEVMINLLGNIIQREINKKQYSGVIVGNPKVYTETALSTGSIIIEFEKADYLSVCEAISNSIIYAEVPPAAADKAVSSKQYRKRLENGSSANQLYSAAINSLYGKGKLSKVYDTEKDILLKTDFNSILEAYPLLLDADRYTAILTGDFDDDVIDSLSACLSLFTANNLPVDNTNDKLNISKNKKITTKIRHTFLTDIPAEKAGPQPAVLIPTTEFLDPVLYITKSPEKGTKESALFNAVMNYAAIALQERINSSPKFRDSTVNLQLPQSRMNIACITINNVTHTKEADSLYKSTIQDISNRLTEPQALQTIVQDIKAAWIIKQMSDTATNSGTARLMQKGLELMPEQTKADYYLQEYDYIQNAGVQDFIDIMNSIPSIPQLRVYSSEGKE